MVEQDLRGSGLTSEGGGEASASASSAVERAGVVAILWASGGFAVASLLRLAREGAALSSLLQDLDKPPVEGREIHAVFALCGLAVALSVAFGWYWIDRRRFGVAQALEAVTRRGRRLALVALVALVALLGGRAGSWATVASATSLAIVGVSALVAVLLGSRVSVPVSWRPSRRATLSALLALCVGYAATVGYFHVLHHWALGTTAFDLGVMENVVWNTLHGHWFDSPLEGRDHLEVHASLILAAIVPVYALSPRAETLLVLQAALIGAAAVPLFFLARAKMGEDLAALCVAAAWLIHPATGTGNLYDFHELAFAPLLYFSAALCLERRRTSGLWISVLLLVIVKEDMGILVALLGLYALMCGRYGTGTGLLLFGGVAFIGLTGLVVERSFAGYYTAMVPEGGRAIDVLVTLLSAPTHSVAIAATEGKLIYFLQIFGPLGFACLLRLRGGVLIIYGLALALFASKPAMYSLGFQYVFYLLPAAFVGAVDTLPRLAPRVRRTLFALAGLLTLIGSWRDGIFPPLGTVTAGYETVRFEYTEQDRERYEALKSLIKLIPGKASVTASEHVVPHLSGRRRVKTVRLIPNRGGADSDYFLVEYGERLPLSMLSTHNLRQSAGGFYLYASREAPPKR